MLSKNPKRFLWIALAALLAALNLKSLGQLLPIGNLPLLVGIVIPLTGVQLVLLISLIGGLQRMNASMRLLWRRILALMIDVMTIGFISVALILFAASIAAIWFPTRTPHLLPLILVAIGIGSSVVFLTRDSTKSVLCSGRRILKLRVVSFPQQTPCSVWQSIIRNTPIYILICLTFLSADVTNSYSKLFSRMALPVVLFLTWDVITFFRSPSQQTWMEQFSHTKTVREIQRRSS